VSPARVGTEDPIRLWPGVVASSYHALSAFASAAVGAWVGLAAASVRSCVITRRIASSSARGEASSASGER
jgi:hypothetical protein